MKPEIKVDSSKDTFKDFTTLTKCCWRTISFIVEGKSKLVFHKGSKYQNFFQFQLGQNFDEFESKFLSQTVYLGLKLA